MNEERPFAAPDASGAPAWAPPGRPSGPSGPPPGYGPPPGAGHPPPGPPPGQAGRPGPHANPYAALSAPKPGVVPLRALGVGDILDGAFTILRRYPAAAVGSAALVSTVAGVLTAALQVMVTTDLVGDYVSAQSPAVGAGYLVVWLIMTVAVALLAGVLVTPVERGVLGFQAGFGESWRRAMRRAGPLIGYALLLALVTATVWAVPLGPVVVLGVTVSPWWFLGLLAAVPVAVALNLLLYVRVCLAVPALVVEDLGLTAAVRRGLHLSRGGFWRLLGILLLAWLIMGAVSFVISFAFSIAGSVLMALSLAGGSDGPGVGYVVVNAIGTIITSTITYPFLSAVTALLYFDRRIRLEGLDIELGRRAASR